MHVQYKCVSSRLCKSAQVNNLHVSFGMISLPGSAVMAGLLEDDDDEPGFQFDALLGNCSIGFEGSCASIHACIHSALPLGICAVQRCRFSVCCCQGRRYMHKGQISFE